MGVYFVTTEKKFFGISFIFAFALMFLLPVTGVFAKSGDDYTKGLTDIYGYTWVSGDNTSGYLNNNISWGIASSGNYVIKFNQSMDVRGFYFNVSGTGTVTFTSEDGSKRIINTDYAVNDTSDYSVSSQYYYDLKTPVSKVTSVTWKANAKGFEIEFFGVPTSDAVNHPNISNVTYTIYDNHVLFKWSNPSGGTYQYSGLNVYQNDNLVTTLDSSKTSYDFVSLLPDTGYKFSFQSMYNDGVNSNNTDFNLVTASSSDGSGSNPSDGSGSNPSDGTGSNPSDGSGSNPSDGSGSNPSDGSGVDTIPPADVSNLVADDITASSVTLKYVLPSDEDLDHINIYNGSVLVGQSYFDSYTVDGLNPETSYNFKVTSVDMFGNESSGKLVNFSTIAVIDDVPPSDVHDLHVSVGSGALYLNWDTVTDKDLNGYNVYVNGVKINGSLIKNNSYTISNLSNGTTYTVLVTAVDKSGNESSGVSATGTPDESGVPVVKSNYSLSDVTSGISKWFNSLWLILAFAIAIPLSFYISSRVKLMFLE